MYEYYVYILKCGDTSYYTGVTNNQERRINEHVEGADTKCYTYRRRPVDLVFQQGFSEILQAIEREKQIKGWTRKKKEALITENIDALREWAKCLNDSVSIKQQE
jgi:putative endonuclease